jgi:hypothetical protein
VIHDRCLLACASHNAANPPKCVIHISLLVDSSKLQPCAIACCLIWLPITVMLIASLVRQYIPVSVPLWACLVPLWTVFCCGICGCCLFTTIEVCVTFICQSYTIHPSFLSFAGVVGLVWFGYIDMASWS